MAFACFEYSETEFLVAQVFVFLGIPCRGCAVGLGCGSVLVVLGLTLAASSSKKFGYPKEDSEGKTTAR